MRKMAIFERQPGVFDRPTDEYTYRGFDAASGLHVFVTNDGKRELFARRKDSMAGWHLRRGAYNFEFCRSE